MNITPLNTQRKESLGPFDLLGPAVNAASSARASSGVKCKVDALEAQLFGAPHLSWRGEPLQLSSQKGWALLCLLAARPEGVAREELAELLWGAGRYANLRQALYQLRHLPGAQRWLCDSDGERVRVKVKSDVEAFRSAVQAGDCARALALSDETLLAGLRISDAPAFGDWLAQRRASVEEERRAVLRTEAVRLEDAGDLSGALELTQTLIQLNPADEASHRAAMRLYYRQGDTVAASAQFAECRRVLAHELGVEPLPETLELASRIERSRVPAPSQPVTLPPQLLHPPHLVGREAVWAQMVEAQQAGKIIFLTGAAGVGKSRLLRDFACSLGSCLFNEARPEDRCSPYVVLARGLHRFLQGYPEVQLRDPERLALARLLPQHFPEYASGFTPSPLDTPSKYMRFTEAVTSLVERMRRSVAALPFDDIHYADLSSHRLGAQVFRQLVSGQPVRGPSARGKAASLIVTYRPEAMPASFEHYIAPLLESGAAVRIELEPLSLKAVGELVESLELPASPDTPDLAQRLYRAAHGNPMLTLEAIKNMMSSGDLNAAPRRDLSGINSDKPNSSKPNLGKTRAPNPLIRRRLETLPSNALLVARAKALTQVEGVHSLADLTELTPSAVAEGLDALERAQVLSRGLFVHELVRETVLADIPETLGRTLHQRAALALAETGRPECVARHWLGAGDGAKAAPYLLQVANSARQIRADQEARLRYFQVLWCTSDEDKVLRKRALSGLSALADLTYDLTLKTAVLDVLEPPRISATPKVSLNKVSQ